MASPQARGQVTNPSKKPLQSAMAEKHPSNGCKRIQRKLQMIETGHATTKSRINQQRAKQGFLPMMIIDDYSDMILCWYWYWYWYW
mmetsp:Transcript_48372/g.117126  ORF Transcript_48372/g.117126 Transcript_48372/m.117126 type:complete len:86 (+) Transcript_48372:262-519(+)